MTQPTNAERLAKETQDLLTKGSPEDIVGFLAGIVAAKDKLQPLLYRRLMELAATALSSKVRHY